MKSSFYTVLGFLFLLTNSSVIAQNVAINFDGSDDVIQTTHPGISGQNVRTVEAMIRTTANCDPKNGGRQKIIVDWGASSTGARFTLNIKDQNALRLEVQGSGMNGQTTLNDGKWHHVAAVYSLNGKQNNIALYVDGVLDTSGSIPTNINTGNAVNVRIGQRVDGINNFDGDIDEVRIFNVARSQSDIKAGINKEYCKFPKGLVAYYKLNEGSAGSTNTSNKTAKDYSSSKKNGTLNNFSLSGSASNWITGDTLIGGDTKSSVDVFGCYKYTTPEGIEYTSPGKYTRTIPNAAGCDSLITLNVTLGRAYHFKRHTVCDSFVTPLGNVVYKSGFYRDTIKGVTAKGCDSVLIMVVRVNQKVETQEDLVTCDSVSINSKWYFTDVQLTQNSSAANGCDSIHTIDITVNKSSFETLYETHCDRFTSSLGNTYTKTGIYQEKLSKANKYKCDSLVVYDLTINNTSNITVPVQDCDSFVSPAGKHYFTTGVHTERFVSQFGCDSIIAYDVVLSETKESFVKVEACDSILFDNIWRTESGTIDFKSTTTAGCDSLVSVDLQVTSINNNVLISGHTLTADQFASEYQWVDCKTGRPVKGESKMSFTAPYSGSFAVDITLNNCTKRSDCYDVIGLGIEKLRIANNIRVIPSPNNGAFQVINYTNQPISSYALRDLTGRLILEKGNINNSIFYVQTQLLPGMYILNVTTENTIRSVRFSVD